MGYNFGQTIIDLLRAHCHIKVSVQNNHDNIKAAMELDEFIKNWRINNKHNLTQVKNVFPAEIVEVGNMTYGDLNVLTYGHPDEKLTIGHYVSIAKNVFFLLLGEHRHTKFSTYPFKTYMLKEEDCECMCKGEIKVEDDVWIGHNATILSGVKIGQGSIVALGSVVTKDVEDGSVLAGNPATVLK